MGTAGEHVAGEGLRSGWSARPVPLRIYVLLALLGTAYSLVRDPGSVTFPSIVFTLVYLWLLKKLWDGARGVWWLFVIFTASGLAVTLSTAFDRPEAWLAVAVAAALLMLLVTSSTRAWCSDRDPDDAG